MGIKVNLKIFIFIVIFYITGQIGIYGILMLFAFIHELGHLLAGMSMGFKPKSMQIMPYGLSISFGVFPKDYNTKIRNANSMTLKKLVIALAGPLTNFILVGVLLCLNQDLFGIQTEILIYANILIGAFNLLPIYPLDGGRILKGMLTIFYGIRDAMIHTNEVANISMILLTMISSIAVYYYKNVAIVFIIIYLWVLVVAQNKWFHNRMSLYKLIDKTSLEIEKEEQVIESS